MSYFMPAITGMTVSSVNSAYSTASSSWFSIPSNVHQPVPPAFTKVTKVIERYESADKAIAAMQKLGLDHRGGTSRPATELLAEAKAAMERPVIGEGGPVTILVPLRESINAALAELVCGARCRKTLGTRRIRYCRSGVTVDMRRLPRAILNRSVTRRSSC